jgi:hypothetical protein
MQTRLDAMAQVAATIQPVLENFYASLDAGQKTQLNTFIEKARRAD